MMIIKTRTIRRTNVNIEDYINIPVTDRVTARMNFKEGVIYGNDNSKVIGVITNAEVVDNNEIELTITLWKNKLQGEYLRETNGNVKPVTFSMGFDSE